MESSLHRSGLASTLLAISLFILGSQAVLAKKPDLTPLEAVASDKARLYFGPGLRTLTKKWLYDWDINKLKIDWFGNQNRFYSFNLLSADENGQFSAFAKIPHNRKPAPHGNYYLDIAPQTLDLALFSLNQNNFSTIQGLPGQVSIQLEAGKNYHIVFGAGSLQGRITPVNEIFDVTLTPELTAFCNDLRGQKRPTKTREKRAFNDRLHDAGLNNLAKRNACETMMNAREYKHDKRFTRMAKWAKKKQEKLQKMKNTRHRHDQKRAAKQ